jgi:hypothetical protein
LVAEGSGDVVELRFRVPAEGLLEINLATSQPIEVSLMSADDQRERLPRWDVMTPVWESGA